MTPAASPRTHSGATRPSERGPMHDVTAPPEPPCGQRNLVAKGAGAACGPRDPPLALRLLPNPDLVAQNKLTLRICAPNPRPSPNTRCAKQSLVQEDAM